MKCDQECNLYPIKNYLKKYFVFRAVDAKQATFLLINYLNRRLMDFVKVRVLNHER